MNHVTSFLNLKPRYGLAAFYWVLGGILVGLGLTFPWVAASFWPALLLVALPCLLAGALTLLNGCGLAQASLVADSQGLRLRLPTWRGFPCPPRRSWHLTWDQVQGLERYSVTFYPFLMIGYVPTVAPMTVGVYTLHTTQGDIRIFDKTLPRLPESMALIAKHLDMPILEGPPRQGSLLKVLLRGTLPAG